MPNRVYSVQGIPCLYGYDYKDGGKHYFVKTQIHNTIRKKSLHVKPGISKKRLKAVAAKTVALLKQGTDKSIEAWIEEYITAHQLGQKTAQAYRRILCNYSLDPMQNMQTLAQALSEGGNVTQTARTVKAFFHWLTQNGLSIPNPAANIRLPRIGVRHRTLTDDEIRTYYRKLSESGTELQLFGRLLLETGARVGTVYNIHVSDLSPQGLRLRNLKCKRDYPLIVPISDATRHLWEEYVKTAPRERLFLSKHSVLNARLRRILDDCFNRNPHEERIVIHSLRHTAATVALQNGVPLEIVSQMLDHVSINTTYSIYAKPSQKQLNRAFARLHGVLGDT